MYLIAVCIKDVSVLEICLYYRGVCIREESILEKCMYGTFSVFNTCPNYRGA